MTRYYIISILLFGSFALCAQNRDSLWQIFSNDALPDTVRLKSIHLIARSFLYNNPDTALHYAGMQEEFAQESKITRWLAHAWNTQGSAMTLIGDFRGALDKFTRMLDLRKGLADTIGMSTAYNNIGNVYYYLGDYPRALQNFITSQRLDALSGKSAGDAISLLNIGSLYAQLDRNQEAIDYFKRADSLAMDNPGIRGSCYANLATAYKSMDSLDIALEYFDRAIPLLEQVKDDHSLAILYANTADVYQLLGNHEKMFEALDKSFELRQTLGDQQGLARLHIARGNANQLTGRTKSGRNECLRGLQIAESIEALPEIKDACVCLYSIHKETGDNETALRYYERMNLLERQMSEAETQKQLRILEFRRQVASDSIAREDEKEALHLRHASEMRKESKRRNLFMYAGFFLLITSAALYFFFLRARKSKRTIEEAKSKTDQLLLNILPAAVTQELLEKGRVDAREFDHVTVLFTDFVSFTSTSHQMQPQELVRELNIIVQHFDEIVARHEISKIKSIGDAYMAAGGLPAFSPESIKNTVLAALEMQEYIAQHFAERQRAGLPGFLMRAGIHHGSVIAGIIGFHNFHYDIWGDTVNLASRMEKNGAEGRVNISREVYVLIADDAAFKCIPRGVIEVKGKGSAEMWFVEKAVV